MKELRFQLKLNRAQALRYYQGQARSVVTRAENGQTVSFPAEHIRRFIDDNGVNGMFKINFDLNNKLLSIERISR